MKTYIYISGYITAFLLLGWLIALLMNLSHHLIMLIAGCIVFFLVYLPLVMLKRKIHKERMREIIQKYQASNKKNGEDASHHEPGTESRDENTGKAWKGWGMNNSPYRNRKSGVTWGGGNIHAANATRGTRRNRK